MALVRLDALGRVTGLRLRALQAEMTQLLTQETALRRNLSDLSAARRQHLRVTEGEDGLATTAGAEVRWQAWVDQRRSVVNSELAQILARKSDLAQQLRIAFGKDQVVQALLVKQAIAWRKARQSRQDQLS